MCAQNDVFNNIMERLVETDDTIGWLSKVMKPHMDSFPKDDAFFG